MSYQHNYTFQKITGLFCACSGIIRALRMIGLRFDTVVSATRVITVVMKKQLNEYENNSSTVLNVRFKY